MQAHKAVRAPHHPELPSLQHNSCGSCLCGAPQPARAAVQRGAGKQPVQCDRLLAAAGTGEWHGVFVRPGALAHNLVCAWLGPGVAAIGWFNVDCCGLIHARCSWAVRSRSQQLPRAQCPHLARDMATHTCSSRPPLSRRSPDGWPTMCQPAAGVWWPQLQDTRPGPAARPVDQLGNVHTHHSAVDALREAAAAAGAAAHHRCRSSPVSADTARCPAGRLLLHPARDWPDACVHLRSSTSSRHCSLLAA